MLGRIFRILSGFLLACLASALIKVLFAYTPAELQNLPPEIAGDRLALALPIATHHAIFAAPFALVAIAVGEWLRLRDWVMYAIFGIGIALIGYFAQMQSEPVAQTWSITNSSYPLISFITSGFLGGLVYWLFSGRLAGHHLLTTGGRHIGHSGGGTTHANNNNRPANNNNVKRA